MDYNYKTAGCKICIKKKFDHNGDFTFFNRATMKQDKISKEQLSVEGIELPARCKKFMCEIAENPRSMTKEENNDILRLMSLSLGPWKGGPNGKFPTINIEEYANVFYLMMVRALTLKSKSGWDPERAKWAAYVKWIRLWTCNKIAKDISSNVAMRQAFIDNTPYIGDDMVNNTRIGISSKARNGKRVTKNKEY